MAAVVTAPIVAGALVNVRIRKQRKFVRTQYSCYDLKYMIHLYKQMYCIHPVFQEQYC